MKTRPTKNPHTSRGGQQVASFLGAAFTLAVASSATAQTGADEAGADEPVILEEDAPAGATATDAPSGSTGASASFSLDSDGDSDASATGVSPRASSESSSAATRSSVAPVPEYAGARATRKDLSLGERYAELPYLERYKPEANLWEVGMFGGLFFPSREHNLKVPVLPREEFSPLAGQLGGRLAYFPLSWVGAELEGFGAGGSTRESEFSAVFYGLRAHAIFQLPLYSIVPFAMIGGGRLGTSTKSMGNDWIGAFLAGADGTVPFNKRVW